MVKDDMTKQFKILPDLTCPDLAGYKLPPYSRSQEDDVDKLSISAYPLNEKTSWGRSYSYDNEQKRIGFKSGYNKAREKYEFSESQIEKSILFGAMQQHMFGHVGSEDERKFIKSLRTPLTPIAIEVEMVEVRSELFRINGCASFKEVGCIENKCTCYEFKPAMHPDGAVKVVRWVYE